MSSDRHTATIKPQFQAETAKLEPRTEPAPPEEPAASTESTDRQTGTVKP